MLALAKLLQIASARFQLQPQDLRQAWVREVQRLRLGRTMGLRRPMAAWDWGPRLLWNLAQCKKTASRCVSLT